MPKVQLLEKSVAERIAAGEVVERPVSVIKELVENSLDAASTRITVEIEDGGRELIRVTDDGIGMTQEDVLLAVQRFATSKISAWEDMDSLATLGFRGEALPSIGAVSHLEIRTCQTEAEVGTELTMQGAGSPQIKPCAAVPGTRISVRHLFYNTPARLKFLRSSASETGQITDLLGRMAAAWPEVSFKLLANGREVFSFPVGMSSLQRIAKIWKVDPQEFIAISAEAPDMWVDGFVALPNNARSNRNGQLFLMNGRIIRSTSLSQALSEGFCPLLERGRFPLGLVRLTVTPSEVDVNVHPNKLEVRFVNDRPVFSLVYRATAQALEENACDPVVPHHLAMAVEASRPSTSMESLPEYSPEPEPVPKPVLRSSASLSMACHEPRISYPAEPTENTPKIAPRVTPAQKEEAVSSPSTLAYEPVLDLPKPPATAPKFQLFGQLFNTYIVGLVEQELWVVDQHTAHERVNYEHLGHLAPLSERCQGLVVPELVELSPAAAEFLTDSLEQFREFGFAVEAFGPCSFYLRGIPAGLKLERAVTAFQELVAELCSEALTEKHGLAENLKERLRAMTSCKAAVKAGDPLRPEEMVSLMEQLLAVEHSLYCPHGRPTRIKLGQRELERLFHR